jgi:hypothetical protein
MYIVLCNGHTKLLYVGYTMYLVMEGLGYTMYLVMEGPGHTKYLVLAMLFNMFLNEQTRLCIM